MILRTTKRRWRDYSSEIVVGGVVVWAERGFQNRSTAYSRGKRALERMRLEKELNNDGKD